MKYSLILLFFLIFCVNYTSSNIRKSGYSSIGFVFIDQNLQQESKKENFIISHNRLKPGTKLKITNPENNKFLEVTIKKRIKYDNFYKALISKNIAEKLELSFQFPYAEINEIKSNKSFIAKKAITEIEEKKIANRAPIDEIDINNISQEEQKLNKKQKTFSILVAEFYNSNSAETLKKKLKSILISSNYQLIYVNKKNENKYQLLMGPYNTINKLKNDYTKLYDSNFEDLNIIINE